MSRNSEVPKITFNRFPVKNQAEMMYDMTKKYFHQLLDGLYPTSKNICLFCDFTQSSLSMSERVSNMSLRNLQSFNRFPVNSQASMCDMTKKYFQQLLVGLHLVLVVDVVVLEGVTKKNRGKIVLQLKKCYRRMHKKFQA